MQFTPEWIESLRARLDIVSIVSESVRLKRMGGRHFGLCPFHSEKSPSFSVSPDTGLYYCFGCHAGGDIFKYVMEMERMTFPEAVRHLADRAGVPLPEDGANDRDYKVRRSRNDAILELNKRAAKHYHELLWKSEYARVLDYFHKRGLSDTDIRRFGLGASPTHDSTGQSLRELMNGASDDLLVESGLFRRRDGVLFEFFRGRAMFPIISARGDVLGFGGRIIGDGEPKYLNTGDTPVFNKRQNIYCANIIRKQKLKRVVLVEGYMDAISLTIHGVEGVVATLGTALTPEQVRLMNRYAGDEGVLIAYDGDEPGQKAAQRAITLCEEAGVRSRVVVFPNGQDPDDFIRANDAKAFDTLPKLKPHEFRLNRLKLASDMTTTEGKTAYAIEAAKIIKTVREPVELENYINRLILDTGFPRDVLVRQVGVNAAAVSGIRSHVSDTVPPTIAQGGETDDVKAARMLLCLMRAGLSVNVSPDDFNLEAHKHIASCLIEGQSPARIVGEITDDELRAEALTVFNISVIQPEKERLQMMVADCLAAMKAARQDKVIDERTTSLKAASGEDKVFALQEIQNMLMKSKAPRATRKE